MPRLGHKKSRLGCRQCKTRHVKCDELKPCSNCARHGVACSLMWDPNTPQPDTPAPSVSSSSASKLPKQTSNDQPFTRAPSASSPSLLIDYVLNPSNTSSGGGNSASAASEGSSPVSQSDQFPFLSKFIHRSETAQSDIWVRDLELMHHWNVEAFDVLSQRDDTRHMWRVEAPKAGFTHTFLIHEMLAFSAFHKAHQQPEQQAEYYTDGIRHQDLAIRGIRERLHNVTHDEAAPIVASSTLLTLSVFASTGFEANRANVATSQCPIDGILNIFNLMQGMGNVLAMEQRTVRDSFLAPMFRDSLEHIPSQPMLQELVQHLPTLVSFIEGKRDIPVPERKEYLSAIAHFEPVLQSAMPPCVDNRELRFLFFWPLYLESEFFVYTRQRKSGAIVIMMYYATMLFVSEPRYWFLGGWGNRLMRACYEAVDQSWTPAIQWPISFLPQNPTFGLFENLVRRRQAPAAQAQVPYTQRPMVSIPHREQSSTAFLSHEQSLGSSYNQQISAANPYQDQKPSTKTYESSSGSPASKDAG